MRSLIKTCARVGLVVLGLSLPVAVAVAEAAPVTFYFTGTIGNVDAPLYTPNGTGSNGFNGALPVSGNYTFESSTSGGAGDFDAILHGSITIGDYTVPVTTPGPAQEIVLINSFPDQYKVQMFGSTPQPLVNSFAPGAIRLELTDLSGQMLANQIQLPTVPPSLGSVNHTEWRLEFNSNAIVSGPITSFTAVPLPPAVILFGAGLVALVGLGAGRWRKGKSGLA